MPSGSPDAADPPSRGEKTDIAGIVLAGGASRRMGRDKATLRLPGGAAETLLERAVGHLGEAGATRVLIATGRAGRLGPLPWAEVDDGPYAGQGPLAGMTAALEAVRDAGIALVLAVDLPDASPRLLAWLARRLSASGHPAIVPTDPAGRPQPLHAAYRPSVAAPFLARYLESGDDRRVLGAIDALGAVRLLPPAELGGTGWHRNVNEPSDLGGG